MSLVSNLKATKSRSRFSDSLKNSTVHPPASLVKKSLQGQDKQGHYGDLLFAIQGYLFRSILLVKAVQILFGTHVVIKKCDKHNYHDS